MLKILPSGWASFCFVFKSNETKQRKVSTSAQLSGHCQVLSHLSHPHPTQLDSNQLRGQRALPQPLGDLWCLV